MTTIAVGIPTKDNEDTIAETLRSLQNQTRPPDRIIVVDASTDETPRIIDDVAAEASVPVAFLREFDRWRGVSGARQQIYDELDEDVLACLDTGKRAPPDWVEQHVTFHEAQPEFDVLTVAKGGSGGPVADVKHPDFLHQNNCSITRRALERVDGWDPWLARGEDWDIRIRLWASGCRSYALPDLNVENIKPDSPTRYVLKTLGRPSSFAFLRKYGRWYLRFHPIHVVGDVASIAAVACLVFGLGIGWIWPPALALLVVPLLGSALFLHFDVYRNRREGWASASWRDLLRLLRFHLYGYTAVRELVRGGGEDWNLGGWCDDRD